MTDQAPHPHLDDEDLSALLDGEAGDERSVAHLASCSSCGARHQALAGARDALRSAAVAPLAGAVLDRLVSAALEAPAEAPTPAPVVPIDRSRARGRRLSSPPPAWLLGAVASIAVLAGLAGLLRAGGGDDDDRSLTDSALPAEESAGDDAFAEGGVENEAAAAVDPELVTADLGDIGDAAALTAALDAPNAQAFAAGRAVAGDDTSSDADEAAPAAPTTLVGPTAGAGGRVAAGAAPAGTRAQCRAEAEAAGDGRLGPLQATAVLRWEGRPAEVLVFALAEPVDGFSRQALVLGRPGCALLADPRF